MKASGTKEAKVTGMCVKHKKSKGRISQGTETKRKRGEWISLRHKCKADIQGEQSRADRTNQKHCFHTEGY